MSIKNIMLVSNEPSDTVGAEQTTLNFAKRFNASVTLVDSIRTPFNASRCPNISTDVIYEAAVIAKTEYLLQLKKQFANEGVKATTKVLFGPRTSSELIGTVVENECDLVVRYLKGESSRANGRFGETAENLMRACPVPVLFTEKEIDTPKVVACINLDHGAEENQAILENARSLVVSFQDLYVVCCWEYSGSSFLYNYMDEGLHEDSKDEVGAIYHKLYDRLQDDYDLEDLKDRVFLFNENPVTGIPGFCKEYEMDIAVMCSASLNHPLGRKLGSTIERTIGDLPCALATVKPIGFTAVETQSKTVVAIV